MFGQRALDLEDIDGVLLADLADKGLDPLEGKRALAGTAPGCALGHDHSKAVTNQLEALDADRHWVAIVVEQSEMAADAALDRALGNLLPRPLLPIGSRAGLAWRRRIG